jgi:chromosome segregation ATPase
MHFWFSPLPLPASLISELAIAGLEAWPNEQGSPHGDNCLLVYDSPERHIAAAAEAEAMFSSTALAEGYSHLLRCREASGQPLLTGWRVQRLGGLGLQNWLAGNEPSGVVGDAEEIHPLVASVILSLLDSQPELLEAYNDLELQVELLGSEADFTYRQRLQQTVALDDPLPQLLAALQTRGGELQELRNEAGRTRLELQKAQAELQAREQALLQQVNNLEEQLLNRGKQLEEARDKAERTQLELVQVQEELKQLVLTDDQKRQLLDTRTHEMQNLQENIQALKQELQPKVDKLEKQILSREKELQDAQEDAELTLLQLHQVQEELEHMVLVDRQKQQRLDTSTHELQSLQENIQALQQELQPKVDNLEQQVRTREHLLQESRDDAKLTLAQLHQVQEEMEHWVMADRQKRQLLDTRTHELQTLEANIQALRQELEPKVDNLKQQLQIRDRDLQNAREDADLTQLQLHQVQEELERYFVQSRAGSQLMEAQADQLNRAKRLMAKLAGHDFSPRGDATAVYVEVLPAADPTNQQLSVQMRALLNTYANSLDRANALLTKAMGR